MDGWSASGGRDDLEDDPAVAVPIAARGCDSRKGVVPDERIAVLPAVDGARLGRERDRGGAAEQNVVPETACVRALAGVTVEGRPA